jgi:hypothetical protein
MCAPRAATSSSSRGARRRSLRSRECDSRRQDAINAEDIEGVCQSRIGKCVRRIDLNRFLKVVDGFLEIRRQPLVPLISAAEIELVGIRVVSKSLADLSFIVASDLSLTFSEISRAISSCIAKIPELCRLYCAPQI